MQIDFANLQGHYQQHKREIDAAIHRVLDRSNYIMGDEIAELEQGLEAFTGAKHAITCSSGTDALLMALMALGIAPGDEVITTPFTFIATAEMIALLGATPVFVDIDETTYNIDASRVEEAITERTRAIIPVALYGQPADMDAINAIAERHDLKVIEDAAQSFGATYNGQRSCNLSDIGCTSFFPAKPLGCFGDGGAVFTNDDDLATAMKSLRVHGQTQRYHHSYIGLGARMDTIQAAVLNVKLKYYEADVSARQRVAVQYTEQLQSSEAVLPVVKEDRTSVWAQYSIRVQERDALQERLKAQGIPTAIHYPKPLHLQECFRHLGYGAGDFPVAELVSREILSLPMNPLLTKDEISFITESV